MTSKIQKELHNIHDNMQKAHKNHEHALAVLGSEMKVSEIARFYEKNLSTLDTITASLIIDYLLKNEVDSKQAEAFKDGVLQFANFFQQCKIEMELRNSEDGE